MIEAKNLSYRIGGHNIVEDVSFHIERASFTCLMGPNGAGKSTIIKLLCGLLRQSAGSIGIIGKNICDYKKKELASIMAYVPQLVSADIHFSVEEYIMTGRYPHQSPLKGISPEDIEVVENVLEATSLQNMRNRDMSTLSGGERQRAVIAAALAQKTDILLLDEPTIYLDPKSSMDILELLAKIHTGGKTVLMVTHDINQALMFGSSFLGIKNGRIAFHESFLTDISKLDELFDIPFNSIGGGKQLQILPRRRKA